MDLDIYHIQYLKSHGSVQISDDLAAIQRQFRLESIINSLKTDAKVVLLVVLQPSIVHCNAGSHIAQLRFAAHDIVSPLSTSQLRAAKQRASRVRYSVAFKQG